MEKNEDIRYLDHPHFTVGHVDQWSERGFLLFERMVYFYEVDRKDQCSSIRSPMTIGAFLSYADEHGVAVPDAFLESLEAARA